jgi:ATP-binding cassette subfamily B protein
MIDDVDMIFFLQGGRIVEKGSHEELMRKEGIYYRYVMEGFPREAARHRRGEVVLGNRELAP